MIMRISEYISTYSADVLTKANYKPYPIQVLYPQYYVPGCGFSEETCISPIFFWERAGNIDDQCESVAIIFGFLPTGKVLGN